MIFIKRTIFSCGLIQIPGGEVEVAQHAVAGGIIRQVALHLLQELLRLCLFALSQIKASQRSSGVGALRIGVDGMAVLLLGFGEATARLVIAAQRQLCIHRLGTQFNCLFEVGLGGIGLVNSHLQKGQVHV